MIDDLLDKFNLAGRTRTEILELLGPAEPLENLRVLHGSVEPSGADFYDLREIHGRHAGWLVVEFSGDVATRARWER